MKNLLIREMTIEDYDEVFALWQITTKRALSSADSRENISKYLNHNRGMSLVGIVGGKIIATVLAGHDGRRGFIHHMAVSPDFRRKGIGSKLAREADKRIKNEGIAKTHIFCYKNNTLGQPFWRAMGFSKRDDIDVFSYD
ncbi:MAG: GNAT family N-acetyltransferase [Ruminococcus sp.]|nr:GNAT family N-acetyltransferase [Ruminococcus sp.]